jgi:hypothetical protein
MEIKDLETGEVGQQLAHPMGEIGWWYVEESTQFEKLKEGYIIATTTTIFSKEKTDEPQREKLLHN